METQSNTEPMRERFEKAFYASVDTNGTAFIQPKIEDGDSSSIKSILDFIQSEVSRAVSEREEQIVREVKKMAYESEYPMAVESWTAHDWAQFIISVISKPHERA